MKSILLALTFFLTLVGCNKTPVLSPVQGVVCAVEQAAAGDIANSLASALQCTDSAAISASLTAALGNANLCTTPIPTPAPTTPPATASLDKPKWTTIGDVSSGDLKSKKAMVTEIKTQGIVGTIACPIVINTITGFLSNSVPKTWGCTGPNASIQGLIQTLVATCATAVPI